MNPANPGRSRRGSSGGHDGDITPAIAEALGVAAAGRPVVVDVTIDYARKSEFTRGVVKTSLARFTFAQKVPAISPDRCGCVGAGMSAPDPSYTSPRAYRPGLKEGSRCSEPPFYPSSR